MPLAWTLSLSRASIAGMHRLGRCQHDMGKMPGMSAVNLEGSSLAYGSVGSVVSTSSLPFSEVEGMMGLIANDEIGGSPSARAKTLACVIHDGNASPMGIAFRRGIGIGGRWQRRGMPVVVAERLSAISVLLGLRWADLTAGTIDAVQAFLARHMGDIGEEAWRFLWHETEGCGAGTDWEAVNPDAMVDGGALHVSATFGTALEMYGDLPDVPGVYAFGYPSTSGGDGIGLYKVGMSEVSVRMRIVEEMSDATRTVMPEDAVVYRVWAPSEECGQRLPMRVHEQVLHGCLETAGHGARQRLNGREWFRVSLADMDETAKGNGLDVIYSFEAVDVADS